ncbi:MAG: DUF3823 domain-containing protein [Flavihumibacter sp.]
MKPMNKYGLFLLGLVVFASCKKDNYTAPSSQLTGRVVYQGEQLGFELGQVGFELYQSGFGKTGPMGSSFAQDGTMNMLLFDGSYKMIVPNGQGPFLWTKTANDEPDSLVINVKGSQALDIEVTPYYMIRNLNITGSSTAVNATFNLEQIVKGADAKNVEYIGLFVNKTDIVSASGDQNMRQQKLQGSDFPDLTNITLTAEVPSVTPAQNYMFARVGVKIDGVEDWLYSQVQKITY